MKRLISKNNSGRARRVSMIDLETVACIEGCYMGEVNRTWLIVDRINWPIRTCGHCNV